MDREKFMIWISEVLSKHNFPWSHRVLHAWHHRKVGGWTISPGFLPLCFCPQLVWLQMAGALAEDSPANLRSLMPCDSSQNETHHEKPGQPVYVEGLQGEPSPKRQSKGTYHLSSPSRVAALQSQVSWHRVLSQPVKNKGSSLSYNEGERAHLWEEAWIGDTTCTVEGSATWGWCCWDQSLWDVAVPSLGSFQKLVKENREEHTWESCPILSLVKKAQP